MAMRDVSAQRRWLRLEKNGGAIAGRCWKATRCADNSREWAGNCYVRRRAYRQAFAKQDRRRRRQRVDCAYRSSPGRQVIRRSRSRLQSHNNSNPRVAHNIRLPLYSTGQGPLQCKKRTQGCISSLVPILEAGSLMLYPLQRTRQIALAIKGLASSQLGGFEPVKAKRLDRYGVILRDGRLPEKMLGG